MPDYKGIDLGHRDYFQSPRQNKTLYISSMIDSNDKIPRIYISYPVTVKPVETTNTSEFKGVIVASIAAKTLGGFLENQIHPKFNNNIAFVGIDGGIFYAENKTFIGKNYYEEDFQSYLSAILKDKRSQFNSIVRNALLSQRGIEDFSYENSTTTVAYEAVTVSDNNRIGTLFISPSYTCRRCNKSY